MTSYPPLEEKPLPEAPHWSKALGVGIVVMGLAIGTGELILWPHLTVKHGLTILWTALLGITFQYFINQEVARHALATGESFFTSSSRLFKYFAPFWLISAVLLYIWPGWAAALGTIARELVGVGDYTHWAWASLGLVLLLTFTGKVAYSVLEKSLKFTVPAFFILLVVASFLTLRPVDLLAGLKGLFSFGPLPSGIDPNVLLGAIVFAGAGGLLNLCVSLWYRDKGFGQGTYAGRIENPITGRSVSHATTGFRFDLTADSLTRWKKWLHFVYLDQGVIFYLLGLLTLFLLSLNAYVTLTPQGIIPEGLTVAITQAKIFEAHWGLFGRNLFLIMSFLMLFSVMWTVIDAFTRIVSDIIFVNSQTGPWSKYLGKLKSFSASKLYYLLILGIVFVSASLVPLKQPLTLLTISAVLGGVAMSIYTPVLLYLNNFRLPKPLRPGLVTNFFMLFASLFYLGFAIFLLAKNLFGLSI